MIKTFTEKKRGKKKLKAKAIADKKNEAKVTKSLN